MTPRNTASCHHCVTNAWGTMTTAVSNRQPTITLQPPTRSASAPSLAAVRILPNAEQAMTTPAIRA
ncbi:hypothetical protein D3C84_1026660 [compost metagenome]